MGKKLTEHLSKGMERDFQKKFKLSFSEAKLNKTLLHKLKIVFHTESTRKVVEIAFYHLAILEINQKKSLYDFPAYDYIQRLQGLLGKHKGTLRVVTIPSWIIVATSGFVKEKYKRFEFNSIEDVIQLVISFIASHTECLLNHI
jgi:hypothetical protein